jgi:hypothetical protein
MEARLQTPTWMRWFSNRWLVGIAWAAVVLTLASGVVGGLHRGLEDQPDWHAFSHETRYVWEHRAIPP